MQAAAGELTHRS